MSLFLSTFTNKVDRKGRVSVPATFRAALATQPFQGIILFKSYRLPALEGCGIDRMTLLSDSVDQLDLFSEDQDDLTATLFADAVQLAFDGDGRILLPEDLRAFVGVRETVSFVGRGKTFQVWEPDAFAAHQEEARRRLRERGATLKLQPKMTGKHNNG
jgi:MraZ protein